MAHENDPHAREYSAAIDGMAETYGRHDLEPCTLPSVGDRVTFRLRSMGDSESIAGRVLRVVGIVQSDTARLIVEREDAGGIEVVDPRPWPTGHMLPF